MNILRLFKKQKFISGVIPDDRAIKEKQKDHLTEEVLATAAPLNWQDYNNWKAQPATIKMLNDIEVYSQGNVGSCAAQSLALLLAIKNYQEDGVFNKVSAKPIYGNRRNKPLPGMYADDIGKIGVNLGSVFEKLYPSPNDTDKNMSNLDDYITAYQSMAKVLKMKEYLWLYQVKSIDSFAQVLSLGEPIVFTVLFGDGEWGSIPKVKAVVPRYGHMITGLPNSYFTYQGQKAIYPQDSHGKDYYINGRHILTEEWFTKGRIVCGLWFENLDNLEVFNSDLAKPKYNFTKDLYYGMKNSEVAMLQRCLGYEKDSEGYLFPLYQSPTGWFGGLTLKAVKRFQIKYGIEPVLGYVGPLTRKKLNQIFR